MIVNKSLKNIKVKAIRTMIITGQTIVNKEPMKHSIYLLARTTE